MAKPRNGRLSRATAAELAEVKTAWVGHLKAREAVKRAWATVGSIREADASPELKAAKAKADQTKWEAIGRLDKLLRTCAERVGVEYRKHAEGVNRCAAELGGLQKIFTATGQDPVVDLDWWRRLHVPASKYLAAHANAGTLIEPRWSNCSLAGGEPKHVEDAALNAQTALSRAIEDLLGEWPYARGQPTPSASTPLPRQPAMVTLTAQPDRAELRYDRIIPGVIGGG